MKTTVYKINLKTVSYYDNYKNGIYGEAESDFCSLCEGKNINEAIDNSILKLFGSLKNRLFLENFKDEEGHNSLMINLTLNHDYEEPTQEEWVKYIDGKTDLLDVKYIFSVEKIEKTIIEVDAKSLSSNNRCYLINESDEDLDIQAAESEDMINEYLI